MPLKLTLVIRQSGNNLENNDDSVDQFLNRDKGACLVVGNVQSGKTGQIKKMALKALARNCDTAIVLTAVSNKLFTQTYDRLKAALRLESPAASVYDVRDVSFRSLSAEKKVIVCLKTKTSVEKLDAILTNSSEQKIAIFDDESDFASQNTANIEQEKTVIHNLLHQIYERQKKVLYFAVTATPYADLMSPDAFPFDLIHRLKNNDGYCGFKEFRENNSYEIIENRFSSYLEIDEFAVILKDHVRRVLDSGASRSQMLINMSVENSDHEKQVLLLNKMAELIDDPKENSDFNDREKELAISALSNIFEYNQDAQDDWREDQRHDIIVGGNLLSRGMTFPSAFTCVMTNIPKSKIAADTLSQKARWFGYRQKMIKHMKVFTTKTGEEAYLETEKMNKIIYQFDEPDDIRKEIRNTKWSLIVPTYKD